jgi:A/G-specific adenine glycosylase
VRAVRELLLAWHSRNGRALPWRETRDPYAILVSEVMLQQTQVERVIPRWHAWLGRWPTVDALAAASAAEVIVAWQGLGYNRRAINLHRAAQRVAAGGWPDDLTELPGVGPYTAAAVANFAFGRDVLPVDVNIGRTAHRRSSTSAPRSASHAFLAAAHARSPTRARRGAAATSRSASRVPSRARSASAARTRCARSQPASSRPTATRSCRSRATGSSCWTKA